MRYLHALIALGGVVALVSALPVDSEETVNLEKRYRPWIWHGADDELPNEDENELEKRYRPWIWHGADDEVEEE